MNTFFHLIVTWSHVKGHQAINAFFKIKYELDLFPGVSIVAPEKHVCDKFDEQLI